MKKILIVMLLVMLGLAVSGCGSNQKITNSAENKTEEKTATNSTENKTEEKAATNSAENKVEQETSSSEENIEKQEESQMQNGTKSLIVYFSCTGTTKRVAEVIADGVGADLYEIVPVEPYTDADLNWNDNNSRSTKEMNDPNVRPEISGSVSNMDQYDTVYIGYPIWWGEAPRIVDTFVESYDFTGKTVVPFCTSGGSGVGASDDRLRELAGSGDWIDGIKFNGSSSSDEIMNWVNSL